MYRAADGTRPSTVASRWAAPFLVLLLFGCGRLGYGEAALGEMDAAPPPEEPDAGGPIGPAARCGDGEVAGNELCDDGNTVGGDGCSADCLTRVLCGDGVVAEGEPCDDGNGTDGDGCDSDCTFSCADDAECNDGQPCNGLETCSSESHACVAGSGADDGTPCVAGGVCRSGACAPPTCGNLALDAGEDCEDGNTVDGDGCDNDCSFSCVGGSDCDDGEVCNGDEACNVLEHTCGDGTVLADGAACDRDGTSETADICLEASCRRSVCGDGFRDEAEGEECDDGNPVNGDGCDNDCTPSCTFDADCSDGAVCNGEETCSMGRCMRGMEAPGGTPCEGDGLCAGGLCVHLDVDGGISIPDGGLGRTCGTATCPSRQYCCNRSCSLCAPLGRGCLDVVCDGGVAS